MRDIIVQKFGGTSVADTEKIKHVAEVVMREREFGNDVVVVVSAMGHTTDHLVKLAKGITETPSSREMDMLLSTGEGISIALLAMALKAAGCPAVSMNAMQVGIITENIHSKARIVDIKTDKLKKHLNDGKVVVVAGFQGVTEDGEITTLGRGGSDTSAVALAAALEAKRCDIYTDVEGVYTTDPRVVPTASRLNEVSYEEMLELARVGANVLHPRAVETAKQFKVPLRVRSSFKLENKGTLIVGVEDIAAPKLFHAKTGAAVAKRDFSSYCDADILSAIRWHTTGRAGMSVFEMLIYLADYIEDTRTFEDCVVLRRYFYDNIAKAETAEERAEVLRKTMIRSFDMTIGCLIGEGALVDRDTVDARNSFILRGIKKD